MPYEAKVGDPDLSLTTTQAHPKKTKTKKKKKQVLVLSWKISKFNDITQWENYLQFQIEERAHLSSGQSYEPLPVLADQPNNKSKS